LLLRNTDNKLSVPTEYGRPAIARVLELD